jgi:hypothetical protein
MVVEPAPSVFWLGESQMVWRDDLSTYCEAVYPFEAV